MLRRRRLRFSGSPLYHKKMEMQVSGLEDFCRGRDDIVVQLFRCSECSDTEENESVASKLFGSYPQLSELNPRHQLDISGWLSGWIYLQSPEYSVLRWL